MHNEEENKYHKAVYAAKALKVSRITIYRYIKEGKIEAVKIGRNYYISDRAFFRYLCEHRMSPGFQEAVRDITRRLQESITQGIAGGAL